MSLSPCGHEASPLRNRVAIASFRLSLLRRRIDGLAAGYQDLNDHNTLRHELLWSRNSGSGARPSLGLQSDALQAGEPRKPSGQVAWAVQRVLVDQFIASFAAPPVELILDFDTTDERVRGKQAGVFFRGYYGDYC